MVSDTSQLPKMTIIVAVDKALGIGKDNDLLCHLSSDLKRFKEITTGHTVVMGLNTWLSLPRKPLPNRKHIVLAPEPVFDHPDVMFFPTLEEAIAAMDRQEENFIMGGGMVYKTFMEIAQKLLITEFQKTFDADTFFPFIDSKTWKLTEESDVMTDAATQMQYIYKTFERR